jgi:hypothetical protein
MNYINRFNLINVSIERRLKLLDRSDEVDREKTGNHFINHGNPACLEDRKTLHVNRSFVLPICFRRCVFFMFTMPCVILKKKYVMCSSGPLWASLLHFTDYLFKILTASSKEKHNSFILIHI